MAFVPNFVLVSTAALAKKEGKDQNAQAPSALAGGPPRNEQQLSQDQWLRRIPDDPGGLLRRKFMIEHLIKQGDKQP